MAVDGVSQFVTHCEDRDWFTYEMSIKHIRQKCYRYRRALTKRKKGQAAILLRTEAQFSDEVDPPSPTIAPTDMDIGTPEPDEYADVTAIIQKLSTEMSPVQVYNTLQSPTMRESLRIPNAIWRELEPELRSKMMEIRNKVEARRKEQKRGDTATAPIPSQYPSMTNHMTKEAAVNKMNAIIEESMDYEDDCDDDALFRLFTTVQCCEEGEHEEKGEIVDLQVRAHLEYAEHFKEPAKVYAISDGGADSCVLGQNALVVAETGRYARLVGYDPQTTKSARIPIVTAYVKAKAHNGIPILLKINEAPYNKDSPITLLSEYQIRENNFVIDSVARKHRTTTGHGTQRLQLNDLVHIPFQDRGGILGLKSCQFQYKT